MWLGVGAGAGLLTSWHLGRQRGRAEVAREVAVLVARVEDASAAILEREAASFARGGGVTAAPPSPHPAPGSSRPRATQAWGGEGKAPEVTAGGTPGVSPSSPPPPGTGPGLAPGQEGSPRSSMRETLRQTSKAMKRAVGIPSKVEIARRKSAGLSP